MKRPLVSETFELYELIDLVPAEIWDIICPDDCTRIALILSTKVLYAKRKTLDFFIPTSICADAAARGYLTQLRWFRSLGYRCDWATTKAAATNGQIAVLDYLSEKGFSLFYDYLMRYAAASGQLEVVKWLRMNKWEWDDLVIHEAAVNGHREVFKYLLQEGCPSYQETWEELADKGELDLLKFSMENGYTWRLPGDICTRAAKSGNIKFLEWLLLLDYESEKRCDEVVRQAIYHGHTDFAKRAVEEGFLCSHHVYLDAVFSGNLVFLEWIYERQRPQPDEMNAIALAQGESPTAMAISEGHFAVLRWLHEKGCRLDLNCSMAAVRADNVEIMSWLRENNCNWDKAACLSSARSDKMREWILCH